MSDAPQDRATTRNGLLSCSHCSTILEPPDGPNAADAYLYHRPIRCVHCGESLNWWEMVLDAVCENFMGSNAFSALGAMTTAFTVQASPGQRLVLDLSTYGIPSDALILATNYTACGRVAPYNMHGNDPKPRRPGAKLRIYVAPLSNEAPPQSAVVYVSVTWVRHTPDDVAWQNILSAFEAYADGDFNRLVIPANVAVEVTLGKFLYQCLEPVASKRRIEEFLSNAATYSHQLNVVLPAILQYTGFPVMPGSLRGLLNRLRDLRNQIAHKGVPEHAITPPDAAKLLCASLFGFKYLSLVMTEYQAKCPRA
jgi:hypothetical protein